MELFTSNKALKNENEALRKRVAELEQYSRLNNVEIKGVPCTQGEDCVAVMAAIGEKVECPVSPTDLDIVHRVPTKNGQQNIIARFCSRDKKNEFVKKARKARLDTRALGFSGQHIQTPFTVSSQQSSRLGSSTLYAPGNGSSSLQPGVNFRGQNSSVPSVHGDRSLRPVLPSINAPRFSSPGADIVDINVTPYASLRRGSRQRKLERSPLAVYFIFFTLEGEETRGGELRVRARCEEKPTHAQCTQLVERESGESNAQLLERGKEETGARRDFISSVLSATGCKNAGCIASSDARIDASSRAI
ncbi:hypothetical protein HPB47_023635 [Ixodes persulcatus]|uniref:Uncharacterized protein n=1 Tax=Ixodes persulcatus TaxID=34615 RepID=A0AC60Q6G5_IXOPE|nr:hypothetical protein HPB47_023635 [Ixodes persulcatus]